MDSEDTQASLLPSEEAPDRGADEKSKVGPPVGYQCLMFRMNVQKMSSCRVPHGRVVMGHP